MAVRARAEVDIVCGVRNAGLAELLARLASRTSHAFLMHCLDRVSRKCSGYFVVGTCDFRRRIRYTSVRHALVSFSRIKEDPDERIGCGAGLQRD